LRKCGLRDGMVISNHHHLRMAIKWRCWRWKRRRGSAREGSDVVPECVVSVAKGAIDLMQKGTIHHIEGR